MEKQNLINKIKSQFILKNIFSYIQNEYIKYKLFFYSKSNQNKLNIKLIDYQEKYYEKIGFDISNYLIVDENNNEKNYLKKKYDNFLLENKLNKKEFENNIKELKTKTAKNVNGNYNIDEDSEILINLESPFFEILLNIFENKYIIYISQNYIDEFKLKDEYILLFDKINKSKINYSSIFYDFHELKNINYLKDFNIKFNNINKMVLIQDENKDINKKTDIKLFLETLFSFDNIENNLIYLKISFNHPNNIKPNVFAKINNFKSLKYLYIESFHFNSDFNIKIKNIELISCEKCKKISISDISYKDLLKLNLSGNEIATIDFLKNDNYKGLKDLNLSYNNITNINEIIKFTNLENINFGYNKLQNIDILEYADFKNLKELKLSFNEISDINTLEKAKFEKLQKLYLRSNKILSIKFLENVNFNKLKVLDLESNLISNIDSLEYVNFKEIIELDLSYNEISNIKVLSNVQFEKLEKLYLRNNKISNIDDLEFVSFKNLKVLSLNYNNITDIKVLEKVKFVKLKELNLGNNIISNIDILEKINFQELKQLDLSYNNITDIKILEKIKFEYLDFGTKKIYKNEFKSNNNILNLTFKIIFNN